TDGRPESTVRLPDPVPCPGSDCAGLLGSSPQLVSAGSRAVFVGRTPANGAELWSTDGREGPRLVVDLCPGPCHGISSPIDDRSRGGAVLFQAKTAASDGGQIWRSDGTPQGTKRLTAVPAGTAYPGASDGTASLGKTLFF